MKTLLLAVSAFAVAVAAALPASAQPLESVRAASSFDALPSAMAFHVIKFKPALKVYQAKGPASEKSQKASRLLRATGYLNLTGSGSWMGGGFASIPVSGWVNLTDETGAAISGGVYMTGTAMVNVNGSFASGWVQPSAYVTLTENGKVLGTMLVQGNIYLSGFVNGTWVNVNGSGPVSGEMWVDQ